MHVWLGRGSVRGVQSEHVWLGRGSVRGVQSACVVGERECERSAE